MTSAARTGDRWLHASAGSTDTSLWTHYNAGEREYCGNAFPDGLRKNDRCVSGLPLTRQASQAAPILTCCSHCSVSCTSRPHQDGSTLLLPHMPCTNTCVCFAKDVTYLRWTLQAAYKHDGRPS